LAHHPVTKSKTYDEYIGERALQDIGNKKWNKRMKRVIQILKTVFNYDTLYIGGGNAEKLKFELDDNIKIVTNLDGIDGGSKLWEQDGKSLNDVIR
jgi:polyphosphate glucokinase